MSASNSVAESPSDPTSHAIERILELGDSVHAALLYGSDRYRLRTLSGRLAAGWLGAELDEESNEIQGSKTVDLLRIQPLGRSRLIRVVQMTPRPRKGDEDDDSKFDGVSLREFLRTGPLQGELKVVVIEDADRMNNDAANAILKMLEEPPSFAKFILTTTAIRSLLPTVISRCIAIPSVAEALERPAGPWSEQNQIPERKPILDSIWEFTKSLSGRSTGAALVSSEELRSLADSIQKSSDMPARAANALALELVGTALQTLEPTWTEAGPLIAEAHRRIIGNGNPGIVFDHLFTELLTGKRA